MLPVRADRVPRRDRRATRRRTPASPIERVHFFPLGGIAATTDYTGAATARPRRRGPRGDDAGRRCSSTSTAPSSTPTTCTTPPSSPSSPSAAATLAARRVPRPHHGPAQRRHPRPLLPRRGRRDPRPQGGDVPRQPRRQRRRPSPASTRCSTGPRPTTPAAPSSPTPRAPTRVAMLAAAGLAAPAADCSSSATNARAPKPDPAPYRAADGRPRRHAVALGRLRGLAAPASAPPAAPAPTSSA